VRKGEIGNKNKFVIPDSNLLTNHFLLLRKFWKFEIQKSSNSICWNKKTFYCVKFQDAIAHVFDGNKKTNTVQRGGGELKYVNNCIPIRKIVMLFQGDSETPKSEIPENSIINSIKILRKKSALYRTNASKYTEKQSKSTLNRM
jgi:hypothetical protein